MAIIVLPYFKTTNIQKISKVKIKIGQNFSDKVCSQA